MSQRRKNSSPTLPSQQRGGATILVALVLLVIMSLAAFSMAKNSIRDLAISGTVIQGTKADEAAEAGLDWFVVWSHPDNSQLALSTGNKALVNGLATVKAPEWTQADSYFENWDRAFRVQSAPADTSDMVFSRAGGIVRQTAAGGNAVTQKFDVVIRFLGFQTSALTATSGGASGGTTPASLSTQDLLWQVVSEGSANIPLGGGDFLPFRQRREMIGIQSLGQSQSSAPTAP